MWACWNLGYAKKQSSWDAKKPFNQSWGYAHARHGIAWGKGGMEGRSVPVEPLILWLPLQQRQAAGRHVCSFCAALIAAGRGGCVPGYGVDAVGDGLGEGIPPFCKLELVHAPFVDAAG